MPRKKQEEKTLLHGKQTQKPQTLDEVWGTTRKPVYEVDNEDEYERYLSKLNKVDLYEHAAMVGIRPTNTNNRSLTVRKLITEFRKYQSSKNKSYVAKSKIPEDKTEEAKERIRKILSR